jgi:hypothetical protein
MKITILQLLQGVTLVPFIVLAAYSFFIRKEAVFGFLFLGLEAFYYVILTRKRHYTTPRERTTQLAGRLTYGWMFILIFSFLFFEDMPHRYVLFVLIWVILGLFFAWVRFTGRWEEAQRIKF